MEGKSLEDLKTLIVDLYSRNRSQEKIMECLRWHGIETSFFEIHQHLEKWRLISSPSPVHSRDVDDPSNQLRQDSTCKLSVTCHHGEVYSHVSHISLVNIPSDLTPIEKYQQDHQAHELLAYNLQQPQISSQEGGQAYSQAQIQARSQSPAQAQRRTSPLDPDSIIDSIGDIDVEIAKRRETVKRNRDHLSSDKKRLSRKVRLRKERSGKY